MIAALFCRSETVYRRLPLVDVWDAQRDARLWPGGVPCVAHPPCRAWGRYHIRAKARPDEPALGLLAVQFVRENGGVLEHPAASKLWRAGELPEPGAFPDQWGGYSVAVNQGDFGHRAIKPTWLYLVGVPRSLAWLQPPPTPCPRVPVERMCKAEREATPEPFARWLVSLASQAIARQ